METEDGGIGVVNYGTVKAELVFIPAPGFGHLVATAEIAKHLVGRDDRLFVTVLFMKFPLDSTSQTTSLAASAGIPDRIHFIDLSIEEANSNNGAASPTHDIFAYTESYKTHVKDVLSKRGQSMSGAEPPRLAGFFFDMFCTTMMDVAGELGVPSYIYYTSNAAFLGFVFHVQALHEEQKLDPAEFNNSDAELVIPSLVNPLPSKVLPSFMFHQDWLVPFLESTRRFRETKGILVNTFLEYESHAIRSLADGKSKIPPVYPVGPILNLKSNSRDGESSENETYREIRKWLDDQLPSSVVFLCFGSMGSFGADQVKEIACALEHSRYRFLWSLRKPPPRGKIELPTDYADLQEVLPEGFLDRTAGIGKVIGWAPQGSILAHQAVGGFVSHCGWNSILESIWYGVPIAAWPMYAEHQFLAFQLVVELGLAVEIKMDYRKELTTEGEVVVGAEEIEGGIKRVMEHDTELRRRVEQMSDESRKASMDGGSSFCSLARLIQDVVANMS